MIAAILAAYVISTNAPAAEVMAHCRAIIPADAELSGRVILRNRRGIPQAEHQYTLVRKAGETTLTVDGQVQPPEPGRAIMGTDVTWSDLSLEYLWWDDFAFDQEETASSVHGFNCVVLRLTKGERTVRIWVERKNGAVVQAEEIAGGKTVRTLWGRRIKKFDDRWVANEVEVETAGSGHRTKITVEEVK